MVMINAMALGSSGQVWKEVWQGVSGELETPNKAHRSLANFFHSSSSHSTVVLADEADKLEVRTMETLIEWASSSKLILLLISPMRHLGERMGARVGSRISSTMEFPSYTKQELTAILTDQLEGRRECDPTAMEMVARRVAGVTGDCRRAMELLRRAEELAGEEKVTVEAVEAVFREFYYNPKMHAIRLT